eukprot:scaffold12503_cov128-Skeletonema_dohrnii-CCMP3373.AAC.1
MEWFKQTVKQKLGLTPPPSQQSHDADESSVDDTKNDMDIDNDNEQSSEGMAISFEVMEGNDNDGDGDKSDDDSSHQDGQHLEYLTQPRYGDDDDDDSSVKESSSVDIENNDNQADNHDNDRKSNDDEPIPKQRIEKPKQRTARRGGRAKRQAGDLLSKLPSTPPSSSLAALPVPTANSQSQPLAAEKSPLLLAAECNGHNKSSPLISTKLLKSPREANIPKEELYDTNNNDVTYANTHNGETTIQPQSPPLPPRKEHPLLHQLTMKQRAIDRSILHLSDNSYSFVYDESTTSSATTTAAAAAVAAANNTATSNKVTKKSAAAKNQGFISWSPAGASAKEKVTTSAAPVSERSSSDQSINDNNGLPFIGPGLKDQYDTMLKLLRDGLLGTYNDDDEDDNNNNILDLKPKIQSNVSAILMGPRGHGKSLLLERCLAELSRVAGKRKERVLQKMQKLQQQQQQLNGHDGIDQLSKVNTELFTQSSFRVVRINGLLYQGDNAVACTREIARQINAMSRMEKNNRSSGSSGSRRSRKGGTPVKESSSKRQRISNHHDVLLTPNKLLPPTKPSTPMSPKSPIPNNESHQFRLRRSGFNTNISLLDEALRTARIDGIPILIVLEELDTFLAGGKSYNMTAGSEQLSHQEQGGSNDRQLLLYHLLDRVADHKFLVSLVGMTTNLSTINQLEKRVQSRAEGTSKVIYFGHDVDGGYDACVESLLGKFYTPPVLLSNNKLGGSEGRILFDDGAREECMEQTEMMNLRNEVETIFRGSQAGSDEDADCDQEINDVSLVQRALRRNYEMHMDIRWFCGVLDVALSLLMSDVDEQKLRCSSETSNDVQVPKLSPKHIAHALIIMGASLDDIASNVGRPGIPNQNALEQIRWGQLIGDPNHYSALVGTNPRLVTLLDLSGPQIAILMAARRIMARDDARSTVDDEAAAGGNNTKNGSKNLTVLSLVAPLTYKRIEDEYTTSFVNSERYTISSDRYPPHVLYRSFMDLMELDLIRLKKEHCEGGALQYEHLGSLSGANISNLPLFVNLEWELDFLGVLKAGLLKCSTSLREWGLKIMN